MAAAFSRQQLYLDDLRHRVLALEDECLARQIPRRCRPESRSATVEMTRRSSIWLSHRAPDGQLGQAIGQTGHGDPGDKQYNLVSHG
jgi:hypothetical protein